MVDACVLVPVAVCFLTPLALVAGLLCAGGLALAPVACLLAPLACCVLPCALCGCCPPAAGDETGMYYQRRVFVTTARGPVYVGRGMRDGEVFIVNSTVFGPAVCRPRVISSGATPPVLIEEVEEVEPAGKTKTV